MTIKLDLTEINIVSQLPVHRVNTSSSFSIKIDSDEAKSSPQTEVDYTKLKEFLAKGQWKEADLETMRVMLEIADREERGWLQKQDIQQKLSKKDIQTINQLWVQYSEGHFGFSVQARIWLECKGEPGKFNFKTYRDKFCDRTGWYVNKNCLEIYDNFQFSLDAKKGNLPSLSFPDINNNQKINWQIWKETFQHILPRIFTSLSTI